VLADRYSGPCPPGCYRGIDQAAADIKTALRDLQMRQLARVVAAMDRRAWALLAALNSACANVDDLASAELFESHPDCTIITSLPGLGDSTSARVLAEIDDDRDRFIDARALKAYAGSAPIIRASGRSISITHRRIKNDRHAGAGWIWAFAARVAGECRSPWSRRLR
jgi:transposase